MYYVLVLFHIVVCLFLVIVVLLQSGKAADLAGAFGGMGSQTAFGPRGSASILSKATTIAAAVFMVTSMSLAILATRGAERATTVLDRTSGQQKSRSVPQQQPARPTPGVPATQGGAAGGPTSQPIPVPAPPAPAPAKK